MLGIAAGILIESRILWTCYPHAKTVLNSVVLLDLLPTMAKEPCLLCNLIYNWETRWIHTFPQVHLRKWMQ